MANKSNADENIRIGKLLQRARETRGITQGELAQQVGMSKNHISIIECGSSKCSVELLLGYCEVLQMTPNEILQFETKEINAELLQRIGQMTAKKQMKLLAVCSILDDTEIS